MRPPVRGCLQAPPTLHAHTLSLLHLLLSREALQSSSKGVACSQDALVAPVQPLEDGVVVVVQVGCPQCSLPPVHSRCPLCAVNCIAQCAAAGAGVKAVQLPLTSNHLGYDNAAVQGARRPCGARSTPRPAGRHLWPLACLQIL
jgi:hypothetical protein